MNYSVTSLRRFTQEVMCKAGLSPEESQIFTDSLISADMRGVSSHGLTRLPTYAKRVEEGLVANHVEPEIVQDGGTVMRVDGKNGMGAYIGTRVMDLCIKRAKESGSAFATVYGGNHFGCASYFALQAAKEGMIGFAVANGPAAIPPTGSTKPLLGTNPVAISIPAGRYEPLVLDMATSAVARGKVALAKKNGTSIPTGWGLNSKGLPTTDPAAVLEGGSMLPMGGAKGYGIALIVEILCSCLSGAQNGQTLGSFYDFTREQNTGFAFGAIDIGKILNIDLFKASVDCLFDSMKSCPKAEGYSEIKIPGEIENDKALKSKETGLFLSDAVIADLESTAQHYGVTFPKE